MNNAARIQGLAIAGGSLRVALVAAALAAGCGEAPELVEGVGLLVLQGATLIDGRGGEPVGESVVAIEGDRIVAVGPTGSFRFSDDTNVVDVAGRFLVPGFTDVHTHVAAPAGEDEPPGRPWGASSEARLRSQLALGITTIRNPGGPTEVAVALRDAVAAGEIVGPKIFTAGQLIDDPSSINPTSVRVTTEEEVREEVRRQAEAGVDYVKLYFFLPPELSLAAIDEAHRHGIGVIGHIARTNWAVAARAGIDAIVHVIPQHADLLPPDRRQRYLEEARGSQAVYMWFENVDFASAEIDGLIAALVENNVPIDPTLVAWEAWFWADSTDDPSHTVWQDTPDWYRGVLRRTNLASWSEEDFSRAKSAWPTVLGFAKLLHDRGVTILAGSDLPSAKTFHRELELLASAGIPPIEVLSIATRNAARALGIDAESGTIEVGKKADMVVLAHDPLTDIRHTRDIVLVVQAGRILDLDSLGQ